jgi:hypothetical protein
MGEIFAALKGFERHWLDRNKLQGHFPDAVLEIISANLSKRKFIVIF